MSYARPSRKPVVFSPLMYDVRVAASVSGGHVTDCLPCDRGVPSRVVRPCMRSDGKSIKYTIIMVYPMCTLRGRWLEPGCSRTINNRLDGMRTTR